MKNMFSRLLAAVLCAMLLLTAVPCASAETDLFTYDSSLLEGMEMTSADWLDSSTSRTILATFMLMSCLMEGAPETYTDVMFEAIDEYETVYVAVNDEGVLFGFFFGKNNRVTVLYTPGSSIASCGMGDYYANIHTDAADLMDVFKSNGIITKYYYVASDDIIEFLAYILEEIQ